MIDKKFYKLKTMEELVKLKQVTEEIKEETEERIKIINEVITKKGEKNEYRT